MGRLIKEFMCIMFMSASVMERGESYNAVFEFSHKCYKPIKEMSNENSVLVVYAREVLRSNPCRLSFIAKEDDLKLCVKSKVFSITDCRITLHYYKTVGYIEHSYSCNDTSPPEFCVENKDILYISLQNADLYTNANIKLEIVATRHDRLLWIIGAVFGAIVVSFVLYVHVCKRRVLVYCKKRKAQVNTDKQLKDTQNSSIQASSQLGSSNTSKSTATKPKVATSSKTTSTTKPATKKQSKPKSKPLASGAASSHIAETIPGPQQLQLPSMPMSSDVQPDPYNSPLTKTIPTMQSTEVQVVIHPVASDNDFYPSATSEKKSSPPDFEITMQGDQNENNGRLLPTQMEAPEYHTLFVSPPPYNEHAEQ